ncbi:signal peptidase II [Corallococcus macrosporus DSM 14697]|uniref:Lipoprotein signal peptidase n=1 Tax=Corallococcus macrosporus DSM 14697 TaxID=1189310 RepID=A0A250JWM2_9BACT|nr:signal peptidase II [Corallococcus macrosporus DSM 14697]
MSTPSLTNGPARLGYLLAVGGAWFVADQLTKHLAREGARRPVTVFESWWHFHYVENRAGAFGMFSSFSEAWRMPFFYGVGAICIVLLIGYFLHTPPAMTLQRWSLATMIGGALGNYVDRVRLRHVVDFVSWHVGDRFYWPTFNVADVAVVLGAALMILESFRAPRQQVSAG